MARIHRIDPCPWFDDQAAEATKHDVAILRAGTG
jgi:hypothetical protein